MKRGGKELDKDVIEIQAEIDIVESQIRTGLAETILKVCTIVDEGMTILSQLDVVFAKAAFGVRTNGVIPRVSDDGRLSVKGFIHPLLCAGNSLLPLEEAVPIDLSLSPEDGGRALIISGPNGGGKTLVLKSFGVVSTFGKLGLPIPLERDSSNKPRVDFFEAVLVNIGDQQSVVEGESTWTGMLNSCASIVDTVSQGAIDENFLVLLDELGSGTDPEAGGAIAQAILEQMMSHQSCYVVATTHSPRLKALSYKSPKIGCATVLLKGGTSNDGYKLPSFQLQYGVIGESYAMGAASRCIPALPEYVLSRASQLMAESLSEVEGTGGGNGYFRVLTESMEKQVQRATDERLAMEQSARDSLKCRSAMISLASSYVQHLSRLEHRLESYFQQLKNEGTENADLVGETISELRVVQRQILGQKDGLKERGLKLLPTSYDLQVGESIVIIAEGELDGSTVKVVADSTTDPALAPNEVLVQPSSSFFGWEDPLGKTSDAEKPFVVPRHELGIWDYESAWEEEDDRLSSVTSTADSKRRLTSLLSTLKTTPSVKTKERPNKDGAISNSSFTSARERKAVKTKAKKKGKRKK
jgi:DNA mismatch repair protein MutS2